MKNLCPCRAQGPNSGYHGRAAGRTPSPTSSPVTSLPQPARQLSFAKPANLLFPLALLLLSLRLLFHLQFLLLCFQSLPLVHFHCSKCQAENQRLGCQDIQQQGHMIEDLQEKRTPECSTGDTACFFRVPSSHKYLLGTKPGAGATPGTKQTRTCPMSPAALLITPLLLALWEGTASTPDITSGLSQLNEICGPRACALLLDNCKLQGKELDPGGFRHSLPHDRDGHCTFWSFCLIPCV